jgi:hypothetical protein
MISQGKWQTKLIILTKTIAKGNQALLNIDNA